jgi:hypothetical protein
MPLFGFLVKCMASTETTIFLKLQFIGSLALVLGRGVIALFAFGTAQSNNISHCPLPV